MQFANIKLYHYPASRSARVKWLLHETVDNNFDVEVVALYDGLQYDEAYLHKNPNHAVPVLELTLPGGDRKTMFESGAIISFLADCFPDKNLAPAADQGSFERADYLQMLHFGSTWMDMMLWQIRIHNDILPAAQQHQPTLDRYRQKIASEVEPQLIARLQQSPYICGESFTAADCVMLHNVMWAKTYGLCTDKVFSRYLSQLSKRPAFVQAFSDAHKFEARVPEDKALISRFTG